MKQYVNEDKQLKAALDLHYAEIMQSVPDREGADPTKLLFERMNSLTKIVKFFRVTECFGKKTHRLELNVQDDSTAASVAHAAISMIVSKAKGVFKNTQAPRGKLEREMAALMGGPRSSAD